MVRKYSVKGKMAKARRHIDRKYKGYGSKKSFDADHARAAKNPGRKPGQTGLGNRGDTVKRKSFKDLL